MPKWMWPLVAALYPMIAHATFHTWKIETIYSSADGTVQFVVLHESQGFAAQDQWAGKTFTNTHAGLTKTFNDMLALAARKELLSTVKVICMSQHHSAEDAESSAFRNSAVRNWF